MKVAYRTEATATGGRDGQAKTADGRLAVKLAVPKELGGSGGDAGATNPEQLFAAGYAACFLGAMKHVAGKSNVKIPDAASVTARVGIGPRSSGLGFGLDVDLEIKVPGMDRATADDLVAKANVVCPYSHATRDNVAVRLKVM